MDILATADYYAASIKRKLEEAGMVEDEGERYLLLAEAETETRTLLREIEKAKTATGEAAQREEAKDGHDADSPA